MGPS